MIDKDENEMRNVSQVKRPENCQKYVRTDKGEMSRYLLRIFDLDKFKWEGRK